MADDTLRDQVAKAVCSIAIGSERVETVMEIIQEHTAKAELRADAAETAVKRVHALLDRSDNRNGSARPRQDRIPATEILDALDGTTRTVGGRMILDIDKQAEAVRVSGITPIERALIQVGTERSAIDHCVKVYDLDRPTARLLARAVREGEEATP